MLGGGESESSACGGPAVAGSAETCDRKAKADVTHQWKRPEITRGLRAGIDAVAPMLPGMTPRSGIRIFSVLRMTCFFTGSTWQINSGAPLRAMLAVYGIRIAMDRQADACRSPGR
jgi:hypothetical protein